jgi:hypothetical protein
MRRETIVKNCKEPQTDGAFEQLKIVPQCFTESGRQSVGKVLSSQLRLGFGGDNNLGVRNFIL